MAKNTVLAKSYSRVAADYTARIADELANKLLDRALLQAYAEQVGTQELVYDLGCGPGHVGAFLAAAGVWVEGIGLSEGIITQARERYPNLTFRLGDMRAQYSTGQLGRYLCLLQHHSS